jgi:hypothetical protein
VNPLLELLLLTPPLLVWDFLFSLLFTLKIMWDSRRYLLDPRSWFTVFLFFLLFGLALFTFQFATELLSIAATERLLLDVFVVAWGLFFGYLLYSLFGLLLFFVPSIYVAVVPLYFLSRAKVAKKEVISVINARTKKHLKGRLFLLLALFAVFVHGGAVASFINMAHP